MSLPKSTILVTAIAWSAYSACLVVAAPHWSEPPSAPVDRIIQNTSRFIEERPDDASAYYVLGRTHSLALALGRSSLRVRYGIGDSAGLAFPAPLGAQSPARSSRTVVVDEGQGKHRVRESVDDSHQSSPEEVLNHATEAIRNLNKALQLDRQNAAYYLAFAYTMESVAHLASHINLIEALGLVRPLPNEQVGRLRSLIDNLDSTSDEEVNAAVSELRSGLEDALIVLEEHRLDSRPKVYSRVGELLTAYYLGQALESYQKAWAISWPLESNPVNEPMVVTELWLRELVSLEAGHSILRLRGDIPQASLDEIREKLQLLVNTPRTTRGITPIIFSNSRSARVDDLLWTQEGVEFDLTGYGQEPPCQWVRPSTCFLVWDECGDGAVESGVDLFGSTTWQLFFRDGYEALSALDDDGNGWLAGSEMIGISVWQDRDSDGHSDAGEVQPAALAGIAAIATQADSIDGISLMNSGGLVMADGQALPTYDWKLK